MVDALIIVKKFIYRFFFFIFIINILFISSASSNSSQNSYVIRFIIDNKKVERIAISMAEIYTYANNIDLFYEGNAKNGIIAIIIDGITENGNIKTEKLSFMSEVERNFFLNFDYSNECTIADASIPLRKHDSNGILGDTNEVAVRTIVVMDSYGVPIDQQVGCIAYGLLRSLGYSAEQIFTLNDLTTQEIIKRFIGGEFSGGMVND